MSTSTNSLFNAPKWNQAMFGGVTAPGGRSVQVGEGILYPALRKAQVTLGPGRTPSPAQYQDAIDELNRLVGSLNCDRLNIYSITRAEYPLDPPKASYTIGVAPDGFPTADFPVERPLVIEGANILTGGGHPYPVAIATDLQWANRPATIVDSIPEVLYNDRAYPISTLYLHGQPASGQTLELFTWTLVPRFESIADVVLAPPGYEDALVLNLAVRLAPHFQRDSVPPDVRRDAQLSLMRLQSINAPRPIAEVGFGCGCGGYDIYSDR